MFDWNAPAATWSDEDVDVLSTWASEVDAQYRSEVAAFGDAWPGAWAEVARARKVLSEYNRRLVAWMAARPAPVFAHDADAPF